MTDNTIVKENKNRKKTNDGWHSRTQKTKG